MKHLISLLAFSFLIGCNGEKSNETKPPKSVSVNPNLKYEIKGDAVTITGRAAGASGELIIPANIEGKPVTSIGAGAFGWHDSLTSITIPDGVTSIGNRAFSGCTSLTSITIPDSVTSIGGGAFANCNSLTSITIPDGVTSIGFGGFNSCTSLTSIEVGAENVNYAVVNGGLFNKKKTLLHKYPAGKTGDNYTIPDSVTSIGDFAFMDCTSLTSIKIP
ncbi:leucine-rich repeat domain-containing protein, partial [Akkermansiaceae bacterium]|nr:leucine-rich repeat domain-containing protein [Akkermansiaceae bacterium]